MTFSHDAPEGTKLALVEAGLHLFGQQGFAATSTREIASHAGTNIASIAYHFSGKDGLRQACAAECARRIGTVMFPSAKLRQGPLAAQDTLRNMLRRMLTYVVGSAEASAIVPFMLREIAEDGPGVDHVYTSLIEPAHHHFCALLAQASGMVAESTAVKLTVFSLIGQVLYFRIADRLVCRRMGWQGIGIAEIEVITDQLLHNLDAVLTARRV